MLSLHYTGSVAHQHHPQLCCHYIVHRFRGPSTSSSSLLSLHYTGSMAHQHHPQLFCHYITQVPWLINIILNSVVITLHRFRGPSTSSSTLLSLHYTGSVAHQHRFHGPSTSSSTLLSLHYTGSVAHQHHPQLCFHYITQVPWPINIILNSVVITLHRFHGPSTPSSTMLSLDYTGSMAHQHHPQLCCHYMTQVPWPINIILNSVDITLHRFHGPSTSFSTHSACRSTTKSSHSCCK